MSGAAEHGRGRRFGPADSRTVVLLSQMPAVISAWAWPPAG
jgi:hypothetical protein